MDYQSALSTFTPTDDSEENDILAEWGMPYRYSPNGIAHCATCGQKYFRSERNGGLNEPDCAHYDPVLEFPITKESEP